MPSPHCGCPKGTEETCWAGQSLWKVLGVKVDAWVVVGREFSGQ